MKTFEASRCSLQDIQSLIVSSIAPRPIAFVSTLSKQGVANLAPFSFFNAFGSAPPMLAFSPARNGRTGELKDTYKNLIATRECVVNIVTYGMLEQMNMTSAEFPADVSEFDTSGLTKLTSQFVKPWRVQESPIQLECVLYDMIHLGDKPGSGNLALCEILYFHVSETVLNDKGRIDPLKVDHIARNGGSFYTRATPESMFELKAPSNTMALGFGTIPKMIRESTLLTGNLLARLASSQSIPKLTSNDEVSLSVHSFKELEKELYNLLSQHKSDEAWKLIVTGQNKGWISHEL